MINQLSKTIWLVIVTAFVVAGCEAKKYKADVLACGPDVETLAVVPDYASRAIEATGGLQDWTKTRKLELDCVVTFYQPDGSFYLTEQHHEIYPWSNSIRISAQEPLSKFVWQLSDGRFSILEGDKQLDVSPMAKFYQEFAEAMLDITTASVRFLDESVEFDRGHRPVKMEGRWYYTISLGGMPYWSKAVFYQNRDGSLVDMLWFANGDEEKFLAVRGYDYHSADKKGILVPTKVEIFETDEQGALQQRLVKVDYYSLRTAE